MKSDIEGSDVRPLIERVVIETVHRLEKERENLASRVAYTEAQAANVLGVPRHVLRDARLRGEISGSRVGKRIVYTVEELRAYLQRKRMHL